ncbi:MAG: elongation factor P [Verrucomicrobiae bacterium]|nr:elongation factor P [Verrucomicrobiae bacterium]
MAIVANNVRKGMAIKYNNDVCVVLETQHRTPGNLRAFVQMTLRSINTGKSSVQRFSSTEKVDEVMLSRQKLEFSYADQAGYHFIDPNTYETITLNEEIISDSKQYLVENTPLDVLLVEGRAVSVELPPTVTLTVAESAEGIRGDSANNVMKPAKLETGLEIQVPLFIKEGEKLIIDTREGKYISRA